MFCMSKAAGRNQDAVSSLRSFMTLHTVVTSVQVKKEFVSLSYRSFRIPEDILLKSLRLCVSMCLHVTT